MIKKTYQKLSQNISRKHIKKDQKTYHTHTHKHTHTNTHTHTHNQNIPKLLQKLSKNI